MTSSGLDTGETIIPNRAYGYHFAKGKLRQRIVPFDDADSFGWSPLFHRGRFAGMGSVSLWRQDPQSIVASGNVHDYGHGYGFGWFIDTEFGHRHVSHGGFLTGYAATRFDRYPDDKLSIIVLSNADNSPVVGHIADELAVIYLGIPPRKPTAGGEALARRTIAALRSGAPNYDDMEPQMAQATRTQILWLQKVMSDLGSVNTVTLLEAEPEGVDRYSVKFRNGAAEWDVRVNKDGTLNVYPAVFSAF